MAACAAPGPEHLGISIEGTPREGKAAKSFKQARVVTRCMLCSFLLPGTEELAMWTKLNVPFHQWHEA